MREAIDRSPIGLPDEPPALDREILLTENALTVLRRRYLRHGAHGEPVESPAEMFWRVATVVAAPDAHYGQNPSSTALAFYDILTSFRFMPNSPTFTGAGTPLGQLAACFVLPIHDDMGRDPAGIFSTLRVAALIQQTGGGNGFSFSRLRPKGARVSTSKGLATGPVGFLRVYDKAFGEIAQGGTRRGANMAVLRVDHPDILDFVRCKGDEGDIANFNISVGVTDAFMRAVESDDEYDLISPQDGSVWKRIRAREVFDEIARYAHRNGEPGVLFLDTANRHNPVAHLYQLEATNPCGEQWLGPYENCCLGSVNLAKHATEEDRVDWALLQRTVELATCFLDNVVDANQYLPAVPEVEEAARRARRIGLGVMGLGDLMYRVGIRYGSPEGEEFAAQVMEFVRYHAMRTSIQRASARGAFPAIEGSIYDPSELEWHPPAPLTPYAREFGRPHVDWQGIAQGIRVHGIRNAAQTTVAPTGTISTVAGCEAYGCEPAFALAYVRHFHDEAHDTELAYSSPLFMRSLERAGVDAGLRERILESVSVTGSCQGVPGVPEDVARVFVVSSDVPAEGHVRMQAAIQAFVDNSISKTVNFPEDASVEDVARAYQLAWRLGCKGLTAYVAGSRERAVLETKKTRAARELARSEPEPLKPRPATLHGTTYRTPSPLGTAFITINENGDRAPFEVFANVGKAGSDTAAVAEAIGRLISLILRMPSALTAQERLTEVIDQLAGIGGPRPLGFGPNRVRSLPDAVAQVLARHMTVVESVPPLEHLPLPIHIPGEHADLCPDCGQATFVAMEGCRKCVNCGFSEC
ncbi:MAG TPA: adenosylcobalamin-dependent ribonucleoside-diphosphate reductase [Anaerolineae bacterium]|nr:adenosylcobalamin-dependent ribonucleoside-diphosphate reductase [Anaerolineae bacterium]